MKLTIKKLYIMYEDALNLMKGLIKSNPKINFIAITKDEKLMVSTTESLMPLEFENFTALIEWLEN